MQEVTTPILISDLGPILETPASTRKNRCGIFICGYCQNTFQARIVNKENCRASSCGCKQRKDAEAFNTLHGLSSTKIFQMWNNIKSRTASQSLKNKTAYTDKAITMCTEWSDSIEVFYAWCISNGYVEGLTIDRRNNDLGYTPDNCRFVTKNVNARNTRKIRSTNTSGYRGVSYNKQIDKWASGIRVNGKSKGLGSYDTALGAAIAYDTYVVTNQLEHTINGVI